MQIKKRKKHRRRAAKRGATRSGTTERQRSRSAFRGAGGDEKPDIPARPSFPPEEGTEYRHGDAEGAEPASAGETNPILPLMPNETTTYAPGVTHSSAVGAVDSALPTQKNETNPILPSTPDSSTAYTNGVPHSSAVGDVDNAPPTEKNQTNPICPSTDYDIETSSHKAVPGGPSTYGGARAASTTPQEEDPPME